jgi:hypothetical protein
MEKETHCANGWITLNCNWYPHLIQGHTGNQAKWAPEPVCTFKEEKFSCFLGVSNQDSAINQLKFCLPVTQQPNSRLGRSMLRFIVYTHSDTHTPSRIPLNSDQLVAEAATYRQHNKRKTAGFEPAIPAIKRLQTYARRGTLIGSQV